MKNKLAGITALLISSVLFFTGTASSQTATTNTVYNDSFARTGLLNGSAPDVVNATGAVWVSATNNLCDGTEVNHLGNSTVSANLACLPFTPVPGHIYTLSMDLNPTNASSDWLALGYLVSTHVASSWFSQTAAWLLQRGNRTEVQTFGPGTTTVAAGLPGGNSSDYTTFSIVLDTSADQWTVTYYEAGAQIGSPYTYSSNPAITGIGFMGYNAAAGGIDNVVLADINLNICVSPTFVTAPSPTSVTCFGNSSYTFTPRVNASAPIQYQWQLNGANVVGATNSSLTISNLQLASGSTSSLVLTATNGCGGIVSDPISITVIPNPPAVYTIYQDSFSGTNVLNGHIPDVADTGSAVWYAGPGYAMDGNAEVFDPSHQQAFLPFIPKWGHVYVLTADMNPTTGNWLALAYSGGDNVAAPNMYDAASPAWVLQRPAGAGDVQTFANGFSGNTSGLPSFNLSGGFTTFSIVLDTTTGDSNANTGWTLTFYEDGIQLSQSIYGSTLSGNNPPFSYVGIGGESSSRGYFKNFSLTDSVMPPAGVSILSAPQPQDCYTNGSVTFTISAAGGPPIYYQWRLNGTNILTATNAVLSLTNILASQGGVYSVVVSNSQGAITNSTAVLTVLPDPIQGTILYQDSFSGSGTLDGHAPDVADASGATWTAPATVVLGGGSLTYATGNGGGSGAFLPFTPQWGHVYVLSANLTFVSGNWTSLGFSTTASTGTAFYNSGAWEWLLLQSQATIQTFTNDLSGNATFNGVALSGANTLKLILDTTTGDPIANTGWTLRIVLGRNILRKVVFNDANPATSYVGIGGEISSTGIFNNFLLTDSVGPLGIIRSGGNITLNWGQGTLLETTNLITGPWITNNATPPYTLSPTEPQKYFRVKIQ